MAAPTITRRKKRTATGDKPTCYHVVVIGREGAVPRVLPPLGQVQVGRDEDADVRVVDPQASRYHARITLGDPIQVEDLGSLNGTRLRDQPLEAGKPMPFQLGDAIAIGDTVLILQGGEPELEERRVWTHGHLETAPRAARPSSPWRGFTFKVRRPPSRSIRS